MGDTPGPASHGVISAQALSEASLMRMDSRLAKRDSSIPKAVSREALSKMKVRDGPFSNSAARVSTGDSVPTAGAGEDIDVGEGLSLLTSFRIGTSE